MQHKPPPTPAQNKLGTLGELARSRPSVSSDVWNPGLTTQWFSVQAVTAMAEQVTVSHFVKNMTVTRESHRVEGGDAALPSHVF